MNRSMTFVMKTRAEHRIRIRISSNNDLIIIHDLMFDVDIIIGIGKSSAISTSKIMKIIATGC